jgi:hypothetical protein
MTEALLSDLKSAIKILTDSQGHPTQYDHQVRTLEYLVCGINSLNQLPCGQGKTYPAICLPQILDLLQDRFLHKYPLQTRVLLIVPLVNIFYSLEVDLIKLDIPYQFMTSGTDSDINPQAKVVVISPEKLMDKLTMKSIKSLEWSAISLDLPHLAIGKSLVT